MNAQTYLDFATPALAAGALHKDRAWRMPGDSESYGFVQSFCQTHKIEPIKMAPPKARSLAALKRAQLAELNAGNAPTGRDGLAMRAMQYALAMQGVETGYRQSHYLDVKHCEFDKASDGSTRVRAVNTNQGRYEIPNWDFVAKLLPVEPEGVFA